MTERDRKRAEFDRYLRSLRKGRPQVVEVEHPNPNLRSVHKVRVIRVIVGRTEREEQSR